MKSSFKQINYSSIATKMGPISYTHDGKSIYSIFLGTTYTKFKKSLIKVKGKNIFKKIPHAKFEKEIREYASGKRKTFTVKTDISFMNPFARKVLSALKRTGYGKLTTYSSLAKKIGNPKASRAVGNAVGVNPCPIVIPCHRVIRTDGSLGGFGCGLPVKKKLLALESED